jgi:hypothetical protein
VCQENKTNHRKTIQRAHKQVDINPDVTMTGMETFITKNNFNERFKFIALYARRLYSDSYLQKSMQKNAKRFFLEMISPSDLAYVLALIKGFEDGANSHGSGEKKVLPLFTSSKGKKECSVRACGQGRDWNTHTWQSRLGKRSTQQKHFIAG